MRHLRDAAQPTPRTTTNDLAVTCNACLRSADADLAALIAAGYGDTPLRDLRFVCSGCGSADTFAFVSGSKDAGY